MRLLFEHLDNILVKDMRTYDELITISSFIERYRYLKIGGNVGEETFGYSRYLNQVLYRSSEWKRVRRQVILRDSANGYILDLAAIDHPLIAGKHIIIHHMNPITLKDINDHNPIVFDPNNLITTCLKTHNAIHYGDESLIQNHFIERKPGDTWF